MKFNKLFLLSLITIYQQTYNICSCIKLNPKLIAKAKNLNWTFFTYIAADNNLNADAYIDLKEMEKGSLNKNVTILAYLNTNKNNKKYSQKLAINNKKTTILSSTNNLDSGAYSTLMNSINWALTASPTNYVVIDLWNHGSGILNPIKSKRGVCFDDTTGNYLNDIDLKNALANAVNIRKGKKIDIFAFDACLMASLEMEATLADYVNYFVASEETIPATGFKYDAILNSITPATTPKALATTMVNTYRLLYTNQTTDYTLSAIDASKIKPLAQNINQLSAVLTDLLNSNQSNEIKMAIGNAYSRTTKFSETVYIDLNDFLINLSQTLSNIKGNIKTQKTITNAKTIISNAINLIKQAIFSNVTGSNLKKSAGISIYFPDAYIYPTYSQLLWCKTYPNWLNFLNKYLNS